MPSSLSRVSTRAAIISNDLRAKESRQFSIYIRSPDFCLPLGSCALGYAMRPLWINLCAFTALFFVAAGTQSFPTLHESRQLSSDLEVSGVLAGLPPESTRYITRDELLALPQVSFTVTHDTNFTGRNKI